VTFAQEYACPSTTEEWSRWFFCVVYSGCFIERPVIPIIFS